MKKIRPKITYLISAGFFIVFVGFLGIIPFRAMYVFSDFLAFMLRKVFRYRFSVILKNLHESNLEIDDREKKKLVKDIYKNLSDIIVEGIKSFTMSEASVLKRHKVLNPEIVLPFYEKKQSMILVTGHICNWEWGSLSAGLYTPYHITAFYKPLRNPYIDRFLSRTRSRFGTTLASIKETGASFERQKGTPTLFLMAADQSPSKIQYAYWIEFLGRETAFLHGPERHSRINDLPVLFTDIARVKRGHYEIKLSILTSEPQKLPEGEITRRYAGNLEQVIKENPSKWLWSHKRWKHKRKKE
jgi:KDO2-lipid IV(A) lauroyltransferase